MFVCIYESYFVHRNQKLQLNCNVFVSAAQRVRAASRHPRSAKGRGADRARIVPCARAAGPRIIRAHCTRFNGPRLPPLSPSQ